MSVLVDVLIPALGWTGAATSATAYGLVSLGRVASNSVAFQAMNLAGAAALSVSAASASAWPSAAVNVIWLLIGTHSLVVILRSKRHGNAVVDAMPSEPGAVPVWTQPIEIVRQSVPAITPIGINADEHGPASPGLAAKEREQHPNGSDPHRTRAHRRAAGEQVRHRGSR